MPSIAVDGRGPMREAACSELRCPVGRAVARPDGVAGDRIGDFGQDVGVVGEAEPFGYPHGLVGGVRAQDAGDFGEFGVRDGPHLLIDRGTPVDVGNQLVKRRLTLNRGSPRAAYASQRSG